MTSTLDADYLVVGAGAMGMAFTDALIDHADVRVTLVDRRHSPAVTGSRRTRSSAAPGLRLLRRGFDPARRRPAQQRGPEAGPARAGHPAGDLRLLRRGARPDDGIGPVEFLPNSEYVGDGSVVSRVSGRAVRRARSCRVVDARYLAPSIPAETPPPFDVAGRPGAAGQRARPTGGGAEPVRHRRVGQDRDRRLHLAARRAGWTPTRSAGCGPATRGCSTGPLSSRILRCSSAWPPTPCRPPRRDSLEDLFLRLEDAGVMLRIDRTVPTMAKAPTLADLGAGAVADRRERHPPRTPHRRRPGRLTFAEGRSPSPTTPSSCTARPTD